MWSYREITDLLYEATGRDDVLVVECATEDEAKQLAWRFSQVRGRQAASESSPEFAVALQSLEIIRKGKRVIVGVSKAMPDSGKSKATWLSPTDAAALLGNE